jgi:serine/threonine protein kinase/Tfp pilus assembly protein PilF
MNQAPDPYAVSLPSHASSAVLATLLAELRDLWSRGESAKVETVLARHPEWLVNESVLMDLVYEEICFRQTIGQRIDLQAYCDRFPDHRSAVRKLVETHEFLQDCSDLLSSLVSQLPDTPSVETSAVIWPKPGDSVAGFKVQRALGRGGFARVYLATELALGNRQVVIKVSPEKARIEVAREAAILGRLVHRNIVPIHSVQTDNLLNLVVVCMPYLGNATLYQVLTQLTAPPSRSARARLILDTIQRLDQGKEPTVSPPFPDPVLSQASYADGIAHLGAQLADALAYVHAEGICHRDLKPSNVLLRSDGRPMLLDFNLAADEQAVAQELVGTWAYMAPEQLRGFDVPLRDRPTVNARSDLYALGILLYELLAGEHPFGPIPSGLRGKALRRHLLNEQTHGPRPLRQVNPQVDAGLERIIVRCLALEPADRPETAAEVARALRSRWRRLRRWVAGHRRLIRGCLGLVVVASLLEAGLLAVQDARSVRLVKEGQTALRNGLEDQAVAKFSQAIQADPNNAEAYFGRGQAYARLGQFPLALPDFQQAHQLVPGGLKQACVGYCLSHLGYADAARQAYKEAMDGGFTTGAVLNNLGHAYLTLKRFPEARDSLTQALQLDKDLQAAYYNRALVYLQIASQDAAKYPVRHIPGLRDLADAIPLGIKDIDQAFQSGPPSADLYYTKARLWMLAVPRDRSHLGAVLDALYQAYEQGMDPKFLTDTNHKVTDRNFKDLEGDARFETLKEKPLPSRSPSRTPPLVDPSQGIRN